MSLFIRALIPYTIPLTRSPSLGLNHFSKTPSPNTITLGIRLNTRVLRDTSIQSIAQPYWKKQLILYKNMSPFIPSLLIFTQVSVKGHWGHSDHLSSPLGPLTSPTPRALPSLLLSTDVTAPHWEWSGAPADQFSNFNAHMNPRRILIKCRCLCSRSGVNPGSPHF